MQVSTTLVKQNARGLLVAAFEKPLAVLGVAALVFASAAFGAAVPESLPGGQPVAWTKAANRVPVTRLRERDLFPLLGKELHGAAGSDIGQIAGVLVNRWGLPRAVIVDFGGFLGIGTRKVAVAWRALQFYTQGKRKVLVADLAPSQLARAPEYRRVARSVAVVSPPNLGYGP